METYELKFWLKLILRATNFITLIRRVYFAIFCLRITLRLSRSCKFVHASLFIHLHRVFAGTVYTQRYFYGYSAGLLRQISLSIYLPAGNKYVDVVLRVITHSLNAYRKPISCHILYNFLQKSNKFRSTILRVS